ncbi:MAG: heparan-alpha-glucosaminide N-acetyltransferase [Candidatus Thermoplasmatota archaeon]|nr:heparan-alpha-glucosaminide N-acetyltransferase [Candidatus Thermoplasmatota archaeon]
MPLNESNERIWEIDFFRGVAIILMIMFHIIFNLKHFSIIHYNVWNGPVMISGRLTASIFIIIVGISLTISYNKKKNIFSQSKIYVDMVKRGVKIFSLGLLITAITWIIIPERFVIFGILHCIGICIILSLPFISYIRLNVILGTLIVLSGIALRAHTFDVSYLLPFGFIPQAFVTIDYFPLLPWFGVVLYGIALGNYVYPNGQRRFHVTDTFTFRFPQKICFIGRHSLPIYLVHQPLILGFIFLFFLMD